MDDKTIRGLIKIDEERKREFETKSLGAVYQNNTVATESGLHDQSSASKSELSITVMAALYKDGRFMPGFLARNFWIIACLLCVLPCLDYCTDFVYSGLIL